MMTQLLLILLAAFNFNLAAAESTQANSHWKIVPNKEVCMITNMHFARPQIPVEQEGKTYYGCCENCKTAIETDPASRMAQDPLTKKPIDKAQATIAADQTGAVMYFENKANFDKYFSKQNKSSK